jgi:hypothetical protein
MSDDDKPDARAELQSKLKAARDVMPSGEQWQKRVNRLVAQNMLHQELGRFKERPPNYRLDEVTRDRLIVHARQDAAHALLNTISLMDQSWNARKEWSPIGWIVAFSLAAIIAYFAYVLVTTKPTCRDGYVVTLAPYVGWYCAPGYKP